MTPLAITFMIIAMLVIWGGLVVSLVFLARHPLPPETEPSTGTGAVADDGAGVSRPGRAGRRRGTGSEPGPGGAPGSGDVPGQWPTRG